MRRRTTEHRKGERLKRVAGVSRKKNKFVRRGVLARRLLESNMRRGTQGDLGKESRRWARTQRKQGTLYTGPT